MITFVFIVAKCFGWHWSWWFLIVTVLLDGVLSQRDDD